MPSPARKKRPQPRRSPIQGRAQHTVEAILKAAAQILERHGSDAATTNAIAGRAGVSIGSLYQYFADRDALIDELVRRHIEAMQVVLGEALAGIRTRPLPEAVAQLVAAIVASHRVAPRLHQALHQATTNRAHPTIDRFEADLERLVAAALCEQVELRLAAPELLANALVQALGGLVRATLRRNPERLDDPAMSAAMIGMILGALAHAPRLP